MTAATVRQTVSNSSGGLSGNLTVTTASTTAVGDILVAFRLSEYVDVNATTELAAPTGTAGTWSLAWRNPDIGGCVAACHFRTVTAAGAQTVTVTGNSSTPGTVLIVVVVKDATTVGNFSGTNSVTASANHIAPSVDAVDPNELLLTMHGSRNATDYTAPAGMTALAGTGIDASTFVTLAAYSQALTAAGPTGTRTAVANASETSNATGSILLRGTAPASSNNWLAFF